MLTTLQPCLFSDNAQPREKLPQKILPQKAQSLLELFLCFFVPSVAIGSVYGLL
jgi:hypothetical protein